jgi:NAD(P)-dependent dehydrogenase (short-subunit alcohol dehydrogenase family)
MIDQPCIDELERFRLAGNVAIVTGGTGGIGSRLCQAFARIGAQVVVHGRDKTRAGAVAEQIRSEGGQAIGTAADLTLPADAERLVADAVAAFGRIDAIVNTVGGGAGTALYPAEAYPQPEWDRMMDLNLLAVLLPTQAAVRAMVDGGHGGRVLHLSSVRGQLGIDRGFSAYVAAKGALDALTRQQATEWAKHRVTVNAIAPTFVATPQTASLLADPQFRTELEARIPLRRIADTDDLVGAALLLCSEASSFITGQILTLDGGLTACQ